jgi:hypothetical protein
LNHLLHLVHIISFAGTGAVGEPTEHLLNRDVWTFLTLFFDNNHSGGIAFSNSEQRDDLVQLQNDFPDFFLDAFYCLPPLCASYPTFAQDIDFGGSTDTIAAISHTNPIPAAIGDYVYEIKKKLNSGDIDHDFILAPGQTVGLFVNFVDTPIGSNAGASASWPGPDDCVNFQTNGIVCIGADIIIAPRVTDVAIDMKPGSDPNSINPRSKGVIPVSILTTDTFDATTVDATTVLFGRTGTEAAPLHSVLKDVDGDGDLDMVLHFKTQDTSIQCEDVSAFLTGETVSGQPIQGSDSVNTVGCK